MHVPWHSNCIQYGHMENDNEVYHQESTKVDYVWQSK